MGRVVNRMRAVHPGEVGQRQSGWPDKRHSSWPACCLIKECYQRLYCRFRWN
jgi:hypothetical protein